MPAFLMEEFWDVCLYGFGIQSSDHQASEANAFTYWSHYLWSAQLSVDHHLSHDSFPKSERNIVDGEMGMLKRERLGEDDVKTVFWTGQE